jgi:DNA-binding CsgD family transcriptional regulator/tetratricopeptide (TPR) repeat protein
MRLLGRKAECETLDQLLMEAVAGRSRVLVLRGEAGIGKTALLDYVADHTQGVRLARAVGVESEMELAYSTLQQLCWPMREHIDRLPEPQHAALATVFGLDDGPPPDRFLVGLGTLTLLTQVAEREPLVCIVDDGQWLDKASAQTLAFVARRLLADRVAMICAARTGIGDTVLAGLPDLKVGQLTEHDSLALLLDNLHGPLDAAICQRIVAESHGNPLALLEFPRAWTVSELAGGFGLPDNLPVAGRIEESYTQRLEELPVDTRLLVLAAAAEPLGDPVLLRRAAEALGIDMAALDAAEDAGLLMIGRRVEFAHPLVRSSSYRSALAHDRRRVHRALADSTDVETDPDRKAWHRAQAARGPDADVAAELERSAGRAQARGGVAAAAAFLQRALELTEDRARRADRALAAAELSLQAGAFDEALKLVTIAEGEALEAFQRTRADLLRAHLAYASDLGSDAAPRLLKAARGLEAFDMELARQTYLIAWFAATIVGHVAGEHVMHEICRSIRQLPRPQGAPLPLDLLLDSLALLTTEDRVIATPAVQRAAAALTTISAEDVRRWGWAAPVASFAVWDDERFLAISARNLQIVRNAGAFAELPQHVLSFGIGRIWVGDFAGAAAVMAETESIEASSGRHSVYLLPALRALQGRESEAVALIAKVVEQAASPEHADEATPAHWAEAVLYNGLGRYAEAKSAATRATWNRFNSSFATWALPELVEASARSGDIEQARDAVERLAETTQPAGTDFALGIEARCRALLLDGDGSDVLYRDAIERLERRRLRPDQARSHLLYGEWLRREGRRVDAREQLRTAHQMFVTIGMEAFAQRARRELRATGEHARKRRPETRDELTPQEDQIARLARDGLSNPEIAAQLFISAKTVEWHLGKVFTKLGISSRRQLRTAFPAESTRRQTLTSTS